MTILIISKWYFAANMQFPASGRLLLIFNVSSNIKQAAMLFCLEEPSPQILCLVEDSSGNINASTHIPV